MDPRDSTIAAVPNCVSWCAAFSRKLKNNPKRKKTIQNLETTGIIFLPPHSVQKSERNYKLATASLKGVFLLENVISYC